MSVKYLRRLIRLSLKKNNCTFGGLIAICISRRERRVRNNIFAPGRSRTVGVDNAAVFAAEIGVDI